MKKEKFTAPAALVTALLTILLFRSLYNLGMNQTVHLDHVTVGYVCEGDEATPYSENFLQSVDTLKTEYGDSITIIVKDNVPAEDAKQAVDELIKAKCNIIFSNSTDYGETVKSTAQANPDIQFCQAACSNSKDEPAVSNYHTFMGEIYEGWYISGQVAGLKLNEMVSEGVLTGDKLVGFVGAFPCEEVISAYTAFLLGVRSECPDALMHVRYTGAWSDYNKEYEAAQALIGEGCSIIAQNSDTIAPAIACEEAYGRRPVYHISYNKDMLNIAPAAALTGTRIDWSAYITEAVEAVFESKRIEDVVKGNVHGNDVGGGFRHAWIKILELNQTTAPEGSEEAIFGTIEDFKHGKCHVFLGDYVGINPDDPSDTWDLNKEYIENKESSYPTFHYVLKDVVIVDGE